MERKTFDELAKDYDEDPGRQKTATAIFKAITDRIPLFQSQNLLECGAGTGLLTALLAPRVGSLLATDISSGMLDVLGEKCRRLRLKNVQTGIFDPSSQDMDRSFDGVVGSMILHHIAETQTVLNRFYALLRSPGWLALADLDKEDGSFHALGMPNPAHHGFGRAELLHSLELAGFHPVRIETAHTLEKNGRVYSVFLATGQK